MSDTITIHGMTIGECMNAFTFNIKKPQNPIDGYMYFDQTDQEVKLYLNGLWNKMRNRYVIKIPCLTKEENEKLTKIKYNTTYVGYQTNPSIGGLIDDGEQDRISEQELLKQVGIYIDKYKSEYNDKVVFQLEEWLLNRI